MATLIFCQELHQQKKKYGINSLNGTSFLPRFTVEGEE